jgi:hypothetical protein
MTAMRSSLRIITALPLLAFALLSFGDCTCLGLRPAVAQHDATAPCALPDTPEHAHEPACEHALDTQPFSDPPVALANQPPRPDAKQDGHSAAPPHEHGNLVQLALATTFATGPPVRHPSTLVALEVLLLI